MHSSTLVPDKVMDCQGFLPDRLGQIEDISPSEDTSKINADELTRPPGVAERSQKGGWHLSWEGGWHLCLDLF
jgi:hypothetical protein